MIDFLKILFGLKKNVPEPSLDLPVVLTPRVLLVVFDPMMNPAGEKLSKFAGWNPVETLINEYIRDITECSAGLVRYQIVERIEINEFPPKIDGFRYTPQTFAEVMRRSSPPHQPDLINYNEFLTRFNILRRIAQREIDEVWAFGFPHAGFYESVMGGPGAFFCNADPLIGTSRAGRRFIIMGFSYERGVGEMLESFGHRAESIMEKVYQRTRPSENLWKKFIRYEQTHPGQAECGNVHFAPNSERDYDWGNPRTVLSRCDDWYNFPAFKGTIKPVNCAEWGGGDIRAHHKWWLSHFPKVAGRTNGIANNWWQYIIDPNHV
ncbi:MAG: hypothetical protein DDG60_05070 [Anaerolineae bacterium]|nr:MAG: hypothetical protein DDG60_05070 [Anaerolineae bacterium]